MAAVLAMLSLLLLDRTLAAAADVQVLVGVDATGAGAPFAHKWKRSFGSGHSALTLREDWRSQLSQATQELGLHGVRYHGLFDDDMGPVVELSPSGEYVYNWTLIDSTWDFLKSRGVRTCTSLPKVARKRVSDAWRTVRRCGQSSS